MNNISGWSVLFTILFGMLFGSIGFMINLDDNIKVNKRLEPSKIEINIENNDTIFIYKIK